jgi:Integrase core domain
MNARVAVLQIAAQQLKGPPNGGGRMPRNPRPDQIGMGGRMLSVQVAGSPRNTHVELHERAGKMIAAQFLRNFIDRLPYRIHTILTDNGVQFTNRKQDKYAGHHILDRVCDEHGIEHRLTKINHPWTNGQVERMNRTLKEATVKRYHYDNHDQLILHLSDFVDAYNYARRLKTLNGLTPFEYICKIWTSEPERFSINPTHHKLGLNI